MEDRRYSRLIATEEFGYDIDWKALKNKTITIAGVGGIGSLAVSMLARVGVGIINIIDLDIVEEENLNRMIFRPKNLNTSKVEAIVEIIKEINPDTTINPYYNDIMDFEFENTLVEILSKTDLGFMCLDNIPARQYFNIKCIDNNVHYIDSGLLRSGFGGYVHLVKPFETACYQCTGSIKVTDTNELSSVECSASIPTTVNIIASLQVQHGLRFLLNFGHIPDYISYNGLNDETLKIELTRDPACFVCGSESGEDND